MMHKGLVAGLVWVCSVATGAVAQQGKPIRLRVDLTDITRRMVHVTEEIPVHAGMNSLWYPQWIPGQELAGGPIDNLVGISFAGGSGAGKTLAWRRDLSNAFEFHVQVPAARVPVPVTCRWEVRSDCR